MAIGVRIHIAVVFISLVSAVSVARADSQECQRCENHLTDLNKLQHEKPKLQELLTKNMKVAESHKYESANVKIQSNRLMIVREIKELDLKDRSLRSFLKSDECQKCPTVKGKVQ